MSSNIEVAVAEIRGDVKRILAIMDEREKAHASRAADIEDHETRLREMERTRYWLEGSRAVVAAVVGFVATLLPNPFH